MASTAQEVAGALQVKRANPKATRILIIEDHRDSRETLCTLLELLGYQVEVAADGLYGVERAMRWCPAVALIDVGLPLLDGYQVAQLLRKTLGPNIFLVAQTGYGQPDDRRRAWEAGFDAHLTKPVDWLEFQHWLLEITGA
jgi:CheY-like chemotaxis protein